MSKKYFLLAILAFAACSTGNKKPMETPKDLLVHQLFTFAEDGKIAYGHQDDLCYGHSWRVEDWETDQLERSDVKAVTGKYPMVLGFDLGDIEHGADKNLDGVPFGLIRKAALKHIERGGIVTFSWHPDNILTGGNAWDVSSNQVVKSVLMGGENHAEFMVWLQRAADFLESLGNVAVIFRPWHEHTGSWFWWGKDLCTPEEYNELFRMTWLYFVKERGLTNLVWCLSPNAPITPQEYMERYPGDEFVDIMGADFYETLFPARQAEMGVLFSNIIKDLMNTLTALGMEHHKLIALAETGLEGIPDPVWWTEVLYPAIKDYSISYVLTWRNAWDQPGHFFGAWEGFENASDFKAFCEKDEILLLDI